MRDLDVEKYVIAQYGDLLVLNKPYDWPTSGRTLKDDDCIQFQLMRHFKRKVWCIHQLDADTSGLCLFSFSKELVTTLQSVWGNNETVKDYYAISHGEPDWDVIDETSSIGMIDEKSLGISSKGKSAHTQFRTIDRNEGFSLIHARIHTGRTHQIRIHLSHLGFPVVGEEWYIEKACTLHCRQALHAYQIRFPSFVSLSSKPLIADFPLDLRELGTRLGLALPQIA